MTNHRNALKLKHTVLLVLILFVYLNCCYRYEPSFVAVRESDFRFGPVSLPLNQENRTELNLFLVKGGDKSISDYVDPMAPKRYAGLLDLLSNSEFLKDYKNFALEGQRKTTKISKVLKQWLRDPIVYQIVDATQKRPPLVNPISITDGSYWWVFYRMKDTEDHYKIVELLVTLSPTREIEHFQN